MVTVLIADDDPSIRKALTHAFAAEGFHAIAVTDGLEALAALDRQPIDVIVSDVTMPRLTGDQLLATLRRRGDPRPVILMSAMPPSVAASGATAFLPKPFDLDQLLAVVNAALDRASGSAAPPSDGHAHP